MTLTPGAWGEAVARSTYGKVKNQFMNSRQEDDRGFFMRFSYAEGAYGSIIFDQFQVQQLWPISNEQFLLTKEFFMTPVMQDVNAVFEVDWLSLRYQELNVPTYSAIAFYMYLTAIEAWPISWSVEGQGVLYEEISLKPVILWTTFITELSSMEQEVCRNEASDVVFLIDQSGSIGPENFVLMTQFVTGVVATLNVAENNTRVAARTFSVTSKSQFNLDEFNDDLVDRSSKVNTGNTAQIL